ncbi:hypothetical protein NW066_06440 [Mycoplasmopsis felis]|uniref:hypothetical protein n=1 Tax=Mycoplasmopsis felis TaxID=33923 RepID=UPI0021AF0A47|nr:hypothetical protein [Mycoplasmopsis felis]MCU9937617.1 hypothetical protein [Mycoplasmopsis felis]UWV85109.1 hypothetical protein NW066_06440 [Mycoplasmopsis felis]
MKLANVGSNEIVITEALLFCSFLNPLVKTLSLFSVPKSECLILSWCSTSL